MSEHVYDVAVVGGGVVAFAVLRQLALGGLRCVMLEKGADILSGASIIVLPSSALAADF